ncbi:hypothetical protein [Desertivibrio insolitus]|uniref:hypothetical protein n=1 Tax=Herbiconiux sp. SYSU D00978 TaxID=2812562 RepID=UPI001A97C336|nr:hypothetical protein [Herbiconiux sp. SYSU D00978]
MLDLGLLLDVDGPIASPATRTIRIPSILDDLVALTAAGVPVAFITGRSDGFVRESVVTPLLERGLGDALRTPGARMFAVFEKGAVWAEVLPDGLGEIEIDDSVALPAAFADDVRAIVAERYAEAMFYDETKRAMVSVEQQTSLPAERYPEAQQRFEEEAFGLAARHGLGMRYRERQVTDASGAVPFRIDPTIISTDIESVRLDKDHAARRALQHFERTGALPRTWRSVGDSRSDYKMADALHADGYDVAHVDVRPADGVLDKPYPVLTEGDLIHDEAGAALLRSFAERLV